MSKVFTTTLLTQVDLNVCSDVAPSVVNKTEHTLDRRQTANIRPKTN